MEAAKNSVKNILSKSGHHDTTVHEKTAPAVQNETISKTQHEREQVAVDREVHQHHHHTTEQPISHQETLPETHHHREIPVEHREFNHGNDEDTKRRLAEGAAQYKDTQTRVEGEKTRSTEPALAGEHVHHHVHETIQPVVNKQTVEPHVVHTTVPIHEVHHNEAKHHATSALPGVTMDEFKKQGGTLKGSEERSDFFPGEPKKFDGDLHGGGLGLHGHGTNPKKELGEDQRGLSNTQRDLGSNQRDLGSNQRDLGSNQHDLGNNQRGLGNDGQVRPTKQELTHDDHVRPSDTSLSSGSTKSKPSLLDRLNPKKDADGDGKAGFMK